MSSTPKLFEQWFAGKSKLAAPALKRWNMLLAVAYAVQAVAIVLLSSSYRVPITLRFLTSDTLMAKLAGSPVMAAASRQLVSFNLLYLVVLLLLVPTVMHLLVATIWRGRYNNAVQKGRNTWRWVASAVKGSLMLTIIALVAGMSDLASLLLLVTVTVSIFVCGLGVEAYTVYKPSVSWLVAVLGVSAGAAAFLALGLYLFGTAVFGSGSVPSYLYWLYGLVAVWLALAIMNTHLVNSRIGKWANYTYGEVWHLAIGFVGTSVFAWLVFAMVLKP